MDGTEKMDFSLDKSQAGNNVLNVTVMKKMKIILIFKPKPRS